MRAPHLKIRAWHQANRGTDVYNFPSSLLINAHAHKRRCQRVRQRRSLRAQRPSFGPRSRSLTRANCASRSWRHSRCALFWSSVKPWNVFLLIHRGVVLSTRHTWGLHRQQCIRWEHCTPYAHANTGATALKRLCATFSLLRCGVQAAVTLDWLEKHSEVTVTAPVRM